MIADNGCTRWDGSPCGQCEACRREEDRLACVADDIDEGEDDDVVVDDECPYCDFGCSECSPLVAEGPNGCRCGFNGDCNCPFVE